MRALISAYSLMAMSVCQPTPPNPDAGGDTSVEDAPVTDDAPLDAPGPACSVVGTWRGTIAGGPFAGQPMTWTFARGGTWSGLWGSASVNGTWTQSGASATVTDTSSVPTYVACPSSQQGTYALTFSASCASVTWRATAETCDGRRVAIDTISLTRQQ